VKPPPRHGDDKEMQKGKTQESRRRRGEKKRKLNDNDAVGKRALWGKDDECTEEIVMLLFRQFLSIV
jgi:hypothetical protein